MKKKIMIVICCLYAIGASLTACSKKTNAKPIIIPTDTGLVNTTHLDYLYTAVTFPDAVHAAGVYIYSQYPDYHFVEANGEGFTCVDDVSRAALVYLRSNKISSDTATQAKLYNLIQFILEMQSPNGYFYNFLFTSGLINTAGVTSINTPNWWSWRALQALTEAGPVIKNKNALLYSKMNVAINKLVAQMKIDLVNLPQDTIIVSGIAIPQWLPSGSGTDQSAILILGLINYCLTTNDAVMMAYIKKLADGIVLMQQGDAAHFPYYAFLSWENTWHAYGNAQAYALLRAGIFLNDAQYGIQAMAEIDNFYPWLLKNGYKGSFQVSENAGIYQVLAENNYDQIAYGIEPMVFAATEAYNATGQDKYADIAGHLAAWLLGANEAGTNMYSLSTGVCYDAISAGSNVNLNSGAESTIEALLTLQRIENYPAVRTALYTYKKP